MSPSRNAVARFTAVRIVSVVVKVAALVLLFVAVTIYLGGHL